MPVEVRFKSRGATVAAQLISISEVSQHTGLQSSALRYYERAGLIGPRARVGGRRHYDSSVLQTLAAIALLQEVGFTIGEIRTLIGHQQQQGRWQALAQEKLHEIDEHMERVTKARELLTTALACECSGLHTCDLIQARQGRHRKTVQALTVHMSRK